MKKRLISWLRQLQVFSDQSWYGPLIGSLTFLDNFIFIIPTDGILISSAILSPRKWVSFGLWVGFGTSLGALVLAVLVDFYGLGFIRSLLPEIEKTRLWESTQTFFDSYGLWVVFVVSLTPLPQPAPVVLAALAGSPVGEIGLAAGAGRFTKYLVLAYLSSHMPKLIAHLWGIGNELKELGVKT